MMVLLDSPQQDLIRTMGIVHGTLLTPKDLHFLTHTRHRVPAYSGWGASWGSNKAAIITHTLMIIKSCYSSKQTHRPHHSKPSTRLACNYDPPKPNEMPHVCHVPTPLLPFLLSLKTGSFSSSSSPAALSFLWLGRFPPSYHPPPPPTLPPFESESYASRAPPVITLLRHHAQVPLARAGNGERQGQQRWQQYQHRLGDGADAAAEGTSLCVSVRHDQGQTSVAKSL